MLQLIMLGLVIDLAAGGFRTHVLGRPGLLRAVTLTSAAVFAGLAVLIVVELLVRATG